MSGGDAERIALDVHAHLAPVLPDRLAAIDGVTWSAQEGALTIDGRFAWPTAEARPQPSPAGSSAAR